MVFRPALWRTPESTGRKCAGTIRPPASISRPGMAQSRHRVVRFATAPLWRTPEIVLYGSSYLHPSVQQIPGSSTRALLELSCVARSLPQLRYGDCAFLIVAYYRGNDPDYASPKRRAPNVLRRVR